MRIWERDARQRGLATIYVPQEPRPLMPTELSDEIVLVHPAQPFSSSLDQLREERFTFPAGVTAAMLTQPKPDHYFWVQTFSLTHNDITPRDASIGLRNVASRFDFHFQFQSGIPAGDFLVLTRPILVPRGWTLYGRLDAIAAASVVTLHASFIDFLAGELPPWV